MAWMQLFIAGVLEVGWAIGLAKSAGWTKLWPSVATIAMMIASMWLLGEAQKKIPIGTAYPVWTGIGAIGTALIGIIYLKDPANAMRIGCIFLIVIGIIGLRATSTSSLDTPAESASSRPA